MHVLIARDADELAEIAADVFRERVRARPDLAMAVPAGRTPRRMYARMAQLQARAPIDYARMRVFSVDELCPPAPPDGYFWRQVRAEFLSWANVEAARCRPFAVDAGDLDAMCTAYEAAIAEAGGLDLVMLGLGPNAHLASNEPGCARRRTQGEVCERAVTLGLATIMAAREVIVLVSGEAKRAPLARMLDGSVTPEVPASVLRTHPRCLVITDRAARP